MPLSITQIENLSRQPPGFAVGDTVVLQHTAGLSGLTFPVGSQWEVMRPATNDHGIYCIYVSSLGSVEVYPNHREVELMVGRFVPSDSPRIVTRPKVNHKIGVPKGNLP